LDKLEVEEEAFFGRLRGWRHREQQGRLLGSFLDDEDFLVVKKDPIDFCILPFGLRLQV
jgi:hypothetical protein